jgi:lipopolysaccharide transport system ATP-binding protein
MLLRRHQSRSNREDFWALRDLSFTVNRGQVVGIIGRNGAGKSTLLKILSRITEPTEGRVSIGGRVASLLEVGTGFHPELTGRENILLNGAILGMRRAEIRSKFDEIVAFAEVERFLDTPVKHYSSGMYVRLAFAVAAHLEPEILIVDEVLAVGDLAFQKKCLDRMRVISTEEQRTVLLVSHNLSSVLQLCTHAIFLAGGKLAAYGAPPEIVRSFSGSMSPAAEDADLASHSRSGNPRGQARLLSARVSGPAGQPKWQVPFGAEIALEFNVRISSRMDFLEIGLSVFNLQGFEICSSLSSWGERMGPLEPGDYLVKVRYPSLPLVPGTYRFGVTLRSERDWEDHLPEAFDLEIVHSLLSAREHFSSVRGAIAINITTAIERLPGRT